MTLIRVALLHDQPLIQLAVHAILNHHEDLTLVSETNIRHAKRLCPSIDPDVVLLSDEADTLAPTTEEICLSLQRIHPKSKIIILVDHQDECYPQRLLALNISGCLLKDELNESLIHIIRAVVTGKPLFSRAVVEKMMDMPQMSDFDYPAHGLTPREWNVLELMVNGYTNAQIAASLSLSPQTVRNKASRIYHKVGVDSRAALLVWAHQQGLASA